MTYRVRHRFVSRPDGHSEVVLTPGDVVTDADPRINAALLHSAIIHGWVVPLSNDPPAPVSAQRSPGRAQGSPTRAKRTADRRKG